VLGDALDTLPVQVSQTKRFPLGQYRGLRFGVLMHPLGASEVYLEGAATRDALLSREHHGPRAVLNALERLANGYGSECERTGKDLDIAESQLRDYQARLGMPFAHEDYLARLTSLRDRLKAGLASPNPADEGGLSATGTEEVGEKKPTVAELAEKIKALRASHTIETTPDRSSPRRSASAEEPVTARLRRRREAIPAVGSAVETDSAAIPAKAEVPAVAQNAAARKANGPHSARVLADVAGPAGTHRVV
jgi:hypothetical protein